MKTKKRILSIIAAVLCMAMLGSTAALAADDQPSQPSPTVITIDPSIWDGVTPDILYERSLLRGDNPPTELGTIPYTGSGTISNYTYSNKYFTGYSV